MSENKHTPTLWTISKERAPGSAHFIIECETYAPPAKGIVAICGYKPNAEFIVRACNAHEELVECLRLHLPTIPQKQGMAGYDADKRARAALAKATAKPS